jgi:hypothetical protein
MSAIQSTRSKSVQDRQIILAQRHHRGRFRERRRVRTSSSSSTSCQRFAPTAFFSFAVGLALGFAFALLELGASSSLEPSSDSESSAAAEADLRAFFKAFAAGGSKSAGSSGLFASRTSDLRLGMVRVETAQTRRGGSGEVDVAARRCQRESERSHDRVSVDPFEAHVHGSTLSEFQCLHEALSDRKARKCKEEDACRKAIY